VPAELRNPARFARVTPGKARGYLLAEVLLREHLDTDPVECIKELLKTMSETQTPVSRFGLTEMLAERTGLPSDEAREQVDLYCDIAARHVPDYLHSEFHLFWPKVLAFVFAAAGIAVFWYGMSLYRAKHPAWIWFCVGTVVFGIGVFQWVRSLERYQVRQAEKAREARIRLRSKYAKHR